MFPDTRLNYFHHGSNEMQKEGREITSRKTNQIVSTVPGGRSQFGADKPEQPGCDPLNWWRKYGCRHFSRQNKAPPNQPDEGLLPRLHVQGCKWAPVARRG